RPSPPPRFSINTLKWIRLGYGNHLLVYIEELHFLKLFAVRLSLSLEMKIIEANAGPLTNFEVLDFINSKGASRDTTRVIAPIAPSEYKVYDYLADSPACNQTREKIYEFLERSKRYNLAKAEMLNIINICPTSLVEIDPIIEQCEDRFEGNRLDELVQVVVEMFSPPPTQPEPREGIDEDKGEVMEEEQIDEDGINEASDEEAADENDEENAVAEQINEEE
ncbi:RNA_pol_Rpb4 domain-containing protein, partial [Cephalotus follicularis]